MIAAFGRDYPENDTLKWEKESVIGRRRAAEAGGLRSTTRPATCLHLAPDARGRIDYVARNDRRKSEWLKATAATPSVFLGADGGPFAGPHGGRRLADSVVLCAHRLRQKSRSDRLRVVYFLYT